MPVHLEAIEAKLIFDRKGFAPAWPGDHGRPCDAFMVLAKSPTPMTVNQVTEALGIADRRDHALVASIIYKFAAVGVARKIPSSSPDGFAYEIVENPTRGPWAAYRKMASEERGRDDASYEVLRDLAPFLEPVVPRSMATRRKIFRAALDALLVLDLTDDQRRLFAERFGLEVAR